MAVIPGQSQRGLVASEKYNTSPHSSIFRVETTTTIMGNSESILQQEKRHEAAQKAHNDKYQFEELPFRNKWPQNARQFSGKPLSGMVYVAVVYDEFLEQHRPWLAFDTRDEAEICLGKYHGAAKYQPSPFVYQKSGNLDTDSWRYWISVVTRQQARDAGLYCEDPVEAHIEGSAPEESTTASAPNI